MDVLIKATFLPKTTKSTSTGEPNGDYFIILIESYLMPSNDPVNGPSTCLPTMARKQGPKLQKEKFKKKRKKMIQEEILAKKFINNP